MAFPWQSPLRDENNIISWMSMKFNFHVYSHFELKLGFLYLSRVISMNSYSVYTRIHSVTFLMYKKIGQKNYKKKGNL